MNLLELTAEQRSAIEAPLDLCFAILGSPGTGKSTALAERAARAHALHPETAPLNLELRHGLGGFAAAILTGSGAAVSLIDDVEAEFLFEHACAPLFGMQWEEFARNQLDPEVPGLRSPERFMQAAFRLIRGLRDAGVDPARFLSLALGGATEFYANPPNFADAALLIATKNTYHDSLDVTSGELDRQHRREIDLAKILAKLYDAYAELAVSSGRMTGRDAVLAATQRLRENPALASRLRGMHRFAFVDDAQELTEAETGLLRAIFGEKLSGVTLCGDPSSAVSLARRTAPEATFALSDARVKLRGDFRMPRLDVQRLSTTADEASFVGDRVAEWVAQGIALERIAVIFRSVRNVELYEAALLDRNIPVVTSGDSNVFAGRRSLDALALLWNAYDPFRHEWLLRTLAGPAFGLSDASLVTLCGEPADPQRPLFNFDDEPAPTARASRWNPKRDLRLGWNVIRGEQDNALSAEAREQVQRFRRLRKQWLELMHALPFEAFARAVWRDGLARDGAPGSARARTQQIVLGRLLDRINAFIAESGEAGIADVLEYAEQRMESVLRQAQDDTVGNAPEGFVQMLSVEAALGREFDQVAIANVRPGAFPLWYLPEGFLFSPKLGMIPRENAGDGRASRTAKYSYYMFRSKTAQRYNERERRVLRYAMARARRTLLVTAWGTPTGGVTAPELLEELR